MSETVCVCSCYYVCVFAVDIMLASKSVCVNVVDIMSKSLCVYECVCS